MAYSLHELSTKYETLWDQQDILFSEFSEIKKRQERIEYSTDYLFKIEGEMQNMKKRIIILDGSLSEIQRIMQQIQPIIVSNPNSITQPVIVSNPNDVKCIIENRRGICISILYIVIIVSITCILL